MNKKRDEEENGDEHIAGETGRRDGAANHQPRGEGKAAVHRDGRLMQTRFAIRWLFRRVRL